MLICMIDTVWLICMIGGYSSFMQFTNHSFFNLNNSYIFQASIIKETCDGNLLILICIIINVWISAQYKSPKRVWNQQNFLPADKIWEKRLSLNVIMHRLWKYWYFGSCVGLAYEHNNSEMEWSMKPMFSWCSRLIDFAMLWSTIEGKYCKSHLLVTAVFISAAWQAVLKRLD